MSANMDINVQFTFSELCAVRDGLEVLVKRHKTLVRTPHHAKGAAEQALGKVKAEINKHVGAIEL